MNWCGRDDISLKDEEIYVSQTLCCVCVRVDPETDEDPVFVGLRVEVFRTYDIEAPKCQFSCDFELFMEWDDPRYVGVIEEGENAGCMDETAGWCPVGPC